MAIVSKNKDDLKNLNLSEIAELIKSGNFPKLKKLYEVFQELKKEAPEAKETKHDDKSPPKEASGNNETHG